MSILRFVIILTIVAGIFAFASLAPKQAHATAAPAPTAPAAKPQSEAEGIMYTLPSWDCGDMLCSVAKGLLANLLKEAHDHQAAKAEIEELRAKVKELGPRRCGTVQEVPARGGKT